MKSYKTIHVGDLSQASLKKALKGGVLQIPHAKMIGPKTMLLHPESFKKYEAAKKANRGVRLTITEDEIKADLEAHDSDAGGSLSGGSVWSWLKDKALPWAKKNLLPIAKPLISQALDSAAAMASAKSGQPAIVGAVRGAIKDQVGVGLKSKKVIKGSQEAKDKMAKIRAMRKKKGSSSESMKAGSFRLS